MMSPRGWILGIDATLDVGWCCVMGNPGRKRRVEPEDEYWRLLMSGLGTVEVYYADVGF